MPQSPYEYFPLLKRHRVGLSTRLSDRSLARNGALNRQRSLGRSRLYLAKGATIYATARVSQLLKDDGGMAVGDVHIPSALGNRPPRRRRPQLSLARTPNDAQPVQA